jgi:hypothetical protein
MTRFRQQGPLHQMKGDDAIVVTFFYFQQANRPDKPVGSDAIAWSSP